MEAQTLTKHEQPLLHRTVVTYKIAFEGATPAKHAIKAHIAHSAKGTVVVSNVWPISGEQGAVVQCRVYSDSNAAQKLERPNLLAKQSPKAEAPAAEAQ